MAGLGKALNSLGKTTVLGKTSHETDPNRDATVGGFFNSHLPYVGNYGPGDRYHFPSHTRDRPITGPTAGHGNEGEILRRVAQHPSDPFGLKAVGIDNQAWEPEAIDIHDMAYVEWAGGRSVYSEIDRAGGLLDQFGLRDGAGGEGGQGNSEVEQLRADLAAAQEQLKIAQDGWTDSQQIREAEHFAINEVIAKAKVPKRGGGRFAEALRDIAEILPVLLLAVLLSGCASLRALNPFDAVKPADAEWSGVKSGEPMGLSPTVASAVDDPRASALATLLNALGGSDPLGSVMPVSLVGEPSPRWVLCVEEYRLKCRQIPLNAEVHFAGQPAGLFWRPSRLTAENFND